MTLPVLGVGGPALGSGIGGAIAEPGNGPGRVIGVDVVEAAPGTAVGVANAVGVGWRLSLAWRFSSAVWRWRIPLSQPWGLPAYENECAWRRPNRRSNATTWVYSTKSFEGVPQWPRKRVSSPFWIASTIGLMSDWPSR